MGHLLIQFCLDGFGYQLLGPGSQQLGQPINLLWIVQINHSIVFHVWRVSLSVN
jgi:hypothetical protein